MGVRSLLRSRSTLDPWCCTRTWPRPIGRLLGLAGKPRCRCRNWPPAPTCRCDRWSSGTGQAPARLLVNQRQLATRGIDRKRAHHPGFLPNELADLARRVQQRWLGWMARKEGFTVSAAGAAGSSFPPPDPGDRRRYPCSCRQCTSQRRPAACRKRRSGCFLLLPGRQQRSRH